MNVIHDNGDFFSLHSHSHVVDWNLSIYKYMTINCLFHFIWSWYWGQVRGWCFVYLFIYFFLAQYFAFSLSFFVRVCKREFYKDEWIIQNKIERKIYAKKTSNHHHHHQEILILKPVSLSVCVFLCEASYVLSWMLNVDHHWTRES